jgi:hypothetical protein
VGWRRESLGRLTGLLLIAGGLAGVVGCLDAGAPPAGRQLLADRAQQGIQLVDGPVGQPKRILLWIWKTAPNNPFMTLQQVSTIDDPGPGGGVAREAHLLVDQLGRGTQDCGDWWNCAFRSDSLGRLWLDRQTFTPRPASFGPGPSGDLDQHDELLRVDPVTGTTESFGGFAYAYFSPDRTRMWFAPPEAALFVNVGATVVGADGSRLALPREPTFVDDDLLFFTGRDTFGSHHDTLVHRPPGSQTTELLLSKIAAYTPLDSQRGPFLVVVREPSIDGIVLQKTSLYDLTTKTEVVLPLPSTVSPTNFIPSPSGRYVLVQGASATTPGVAFDLIFDRDTGVTTGPVELPPTVNNDSPRWRPGHEDVWVLGIDALLRWRPGGMPEAVGAGEAEFMFPPLVTDLLQEIAVNQGQPVFTTDGTFRVVMPPTSKITGHDAVSLQLADDPTAPLLALNGPGTSVTGLWPLQDGRLLVEVATVDASRNDIELVDPMARTSRALVHTGSVFATGRDRCLALLHIIGPGGSGDLELIDYATGAQTLIAQNVFGWAIDTSPLADDPLAAGTRLVYLVRNRIASPYDGVWAIELP